MSHDDEGKRREGIAQIAVKGMHILDDRINAVLLGKEAVILG